MHMKSAAMVIAASTLCCGSAYAGAIRYTISYIPKADRTEMDIVANWKPERNGAQLVALPQDYYGSGDLTSYVVRFAGEGGTKVAAGAGPGDRNVSASSSGEITLHYRVSYDPVKVQDISFGPISTAKQAQAFCCQWMLRIGDLTKKQDYDIAVSAPPKGWSLYSSLAPNPRH